MNIFDTEMYVYIHIYMLYLLYTECYNMDSNVWFELYFPWRFIYQEIDVMCLYVMFYTCP